jgi:CPA2 family monovalent cation:H+ antiporter-2
MIFLASSVEFTMLQDIVIILGLSVLIILFFQRLKLPSILGLLITGIIVGPYGLNLIRAVTEVELMAEIGVIFLLFVIGIEFSLKGLASIRKTVLIGGGLQVLGTIGLVTLASYLFGLPPNTALFMGFLISLSSTAIVLKMLQERGELTAPYGRVSVAILIFQDIVVVLMVLLIPLLAGQMEDPGKMLLILLAKLIGILLAVFLLTRYIVPVLFRMVVRTQSRELFILTIIVLCFATAWLTSAVGLSLALGAFFAGLIISESDYSHQANANILPFREIFISFFFVSVGMLLDINFFLSNIVYINLLALGVIVLKFMVIAFTVFILRYQPRTVWLTALALFQVGEFAFVLSTAGMGYDLLPQQTYQYFLAISIITMGLTPFMISWAPGIVRVITRIRMPAQVRSTINSMNLRDGEGRKETEFSGHLVIIGYGMNGENVALAAQKAGISHVIIELDPSAIDRARSKGETVVFGDATNEVILKHVHIQAARVIVIAISDPEATRQIVNSIRLYTETAYIIVRTRYVREVEEVIRLGADEVIPEEFETSVEIFTRVMKKYLVPNDEIRGFVNEIRSSNYRMLRAMSASDPTLDRPVVHISDMEIATLPVQQGKNRIVGKSIGESGIRSNFGVSVLAIRRGEEYITDITTETMVAQNDVLYILGMPDDIIRMNKHCLFTDTE